MKALTVDKVLDSIMKLDFSSRAIILEVLRSRQIEERRDEIFRNARQSKADLSKGKLKPATAEDVIDKLKNL
ncbi:MAG: hypothetical protein KF725_02675 [Cyclobacteriaceae bacterium]|nr:hypothetical protein [Cyclobacteriaceae bacterium]UYN86660.1 MAG: hypothetical protein KIT51_17665 [Cyclobacteriaceae bacterium]